MYQNIHCSPVPKMIMPTFDPNPRLTWLLQANALIRREAAQFRTVRERVEFEMMAKPFDVPASFALFGLLLGALPSAAIFYRMFGSMLAANTTNRPWLLILLALMNIVCMLAGFLMGRAAGQMLTRPERPSTARLCWQLPTLGILWGLVAGATGGVFFFGFGALVGPFLAAPVGAVGFLVFGLLHRQVERGGMIAREHLVPLAVGVAATITAFILGI